jgi:hypothetical protein
MVATRAAGRLRRQLEDITLANGARAMAAGKIARKMARALASVLKRRSAVKKATKTREKSASQVAQAPGRE